MFILLPGVLMTLLLLLTAIVNHHLAFNCSDFNPTIQLQTDTLKGLNK